MDAVAHSPALRHSHIFLGAEHAQAERRTWMVIALCAAMMLWEIVGGWWFGSIALVADGLHMSTHAGALLLAALAYLYARKYAQDPRFSFGTGKLGDLAGFTSAIVLAMIALLIGYEAVLRLFNPVPIQFSEAIPIASLGLAVNIASVWLLSGGHHGHSHGHTHSHHNHDHSHQDEAHAIATQDGTITLNVFEDGVPPVFRLHGPSRHLPDPTNISIETVRPDGARQMFTMADRGAFLESTTSIPEPHQFAAHIQIGPQEHVVAFEEHAHSHTVRDSAHRDNNMRAAIVHVVADAAVSVLVIVGLLLARAFGWLWMDPLVGVIGAGVIASWAFGLIRDTGAILLDMVPDPKIAEGLCRTIESDGDQLADLHVWRLGPGHLGAIISVVTRTARDADFYRTRLTSQWSSLSHLTVEVRKEPG